MSFIESTIRTILAIGRTATFWCIIAIANFFVFYIGHFLGDVNLQFHSGILMFLSFVLGIVYYIHDEASTSRNEERPPHNAEDSTEL